MGRDSGSALVGRSWRVRVVAHGSRDGTCASGDAATRCETARGQRSTSTGKQRSTRRIGQCTRRQVAGEEAHLAAAAAPVSRPSHRTRIVSWRSGAESSRLSCQSEDADPSQPERPERLLRGSAEASPPEGQPRGKCRRPEGTSSRIRRTRKAPRRKSVKPL